MRVIKDRCTHTDALSHRYMRTHIYTHACTFTLLSHTDHHAFLPAMDLMSMRLTKHKSIDVALTRLI